MNGIITQGVSTYPLIFFMRATSGAQGVAGLSPTVTISKNGGAFATPAGAVTEIAAGYYKVAGNATDTGTAGTLRLTATGAGADQADESWWINSVAGISAVTEGMATGVIGAATFDPGAIDADALAASALSAIAAAVAQNSRIIIVSPLSASEMTLIKGDDYTQAGTTIALTKASGELGWPSSITTIDFSCAPDDALQEEQSILATAGLDDIALTSVSASGGTLSLTAAQTAALVATTGKGRYRFWFVANRSTYPKTIRQGTLRVVTGDTN